MNHVKQIIGLLFAGCGAAAVYWATRRNQGRLSGGAVETGVSQPPVVGAESSTFAAESQEVAYMNDAKAWVPPAAALPYMDAIRAAESRYNLPTNLLARLLYQESRFRADIISGKVKSAAGALGIAQFMPATAKEFGIDPLNPMEAIPAAAKYLHQLYMRFGNWEEAVAAYNWGQGNVAKKGLENAPTETRNYFAQILADIGLA